MKWNDLSMADRAKYIALGVQNGITSLSYIREVYNSYAKGGPKAYARHSSELPEYNGTYTTESGESTYEGGWVWVDEAGNPIRTRDLGNYDTSKRTKWKPTLKSTGQTQLEESDKRMIEKRVANDYASQFTAPAILGAAASGMNFLSPSQQFGAIVDWTQGEKGYWEGIGGTNSGFFTDKFAEEHPYWTTVGNMAVDGVLGLVGLDALELLSKGSKVVNPIQTMAALRRNIGSFEVGQQIKLSDYLSKNQEEVVRRFNNDAAPRLRRAFSDEGYFLTEQESDIINNGVIDDINFFVAEPSNKRAAYSRGSNGDIGIPINQLNQTIINPAEVIIHELEHSQRSRLFDNILSSRLKNRNSNLLRKETSNSKTGAMKEAGSYTLKEAEYLDKAYSFSKDYLSENNITPLYEKGATNRQLRSRISMEHNGAIGEELDNIIDNLSDRELIKYLEDVNDYSRDWFRKFISENEDKLGSRRVNSDIVKQVADNIRKALKYVGAVSAPIAGIEALSNKEEKSQ